MRFMISSRGYKEAFIQTDDVIAYKPNYQNIICVRIGGILK